MECLPQHAFQGVTDGGAAVVGGGDDGNFHCAVGDSISIAFQFITFRFLLLSRFVFSNKKPCRACIWWIPGKAEGFAGEGVLTQSLMTDLFLLYLFDNRDSVVYGFYLWESER